MEKKELSSIDASIRRAHQIGLIALFLVVSTTAIVYFIDISNAFYFINVLWIAPLGLVYNKPTLKEMLSDYMFGILFGLAIPIIEFGIPCAFISLIIWAANRG